MADQVAEGLLSPFLRNRRIEAVRPWLQGRVLDVGCGSGMLAALVGAEEYIGFDPDEESIVNARKKFPHHKFLPQLKTNEKFNTVVALAVLEHVPDPAKWMMEMKSFLSDERGMVVLTTPHPSMEMVHTLGAKIGLFSSHASEEHEQLIDFVRMTEIGHDTGMKIHTYKRFLLGGNQLFVLIPY